MMHHAQIAQRAFNTPLMVDPAKALAFLSGLGPRITGQEITFQGLEVDASNQATATLPAAEVAQVCAQAARLGVTIDAADAVSKGLKPEALRARVLADLAARSDAAGIIATAPAAAAAKDSPIIAAAKKAATDAKR